MSVIPRWCWIPGVQALLGICAPLHAQHEGVSPASAPGISAGNLWPGSGVMVAGELWDSFLPPNAGPFYFEANGPLIGTFLRIGNFDRVWSTPTHMWPGGWPYGMFWGKGMYLAEYNPDSTWNPAVLAGIPNPANRPGAGAHYALGSYKGTVVGGADPLRNFTRETRWVDATKRVHAVYEAGWPTNIGIDVRVTIHQFTLHWNNFNDFIIVEISLTNTGVLDMNADGVVDSLQGGRPGLNRIRALTMMAHGEIFGSYYLNEGAIRGSRLGAAMGFGYVADPDSTGAPWDMMVAFAGESGSGLRDMGLNSFPEKFYTDVWSAWAWLGVKSGVASSENLFTLPDKETLYQTPAIGTGSSRGLYATAGQGRGIGVSSGGYQVNPRLIHTAAMGTWYVDGGRSRDTLLFNLSADTALFAGGVTGDPTTFVPKSNPSRPPWGWGDRKLSQIFEVNTLDAGWTKGFSAVDNFDGDMFSGIGPFSLDPGESMTIVWGEAGGYRLAGAKNAIAAARWAFQHGYQIPEPPAAPDVRVENTNDRSLKIRWDARAESHPGFAGYRIYKSTHSLSVNWLDGGMRTLDQYWRTPVPGPVPQSLLRPINPSFLAFDLTEGITGKAGTWGPYELVASIPPGGLSSYVEPGASGTKYSWVDRQVDPGSTYSYVVAASATGLFDLGSSYAGLNASSTGVIESGNFNTNGAEGLWQGTYPFAYLNPMFPKTSEGKRRMGVGVPFFNSALADPADLASGKTRVGVRPNPYKLKALWDNRSDPMDHRVMFYNLPATATITILDVSGQTMARIDFQSPDGEIGSTTWNLISKDGYEVASGLYIYVVEYNGGKQYGYFSVLR